MSVAGPFAPHHPSAWEMAAAAGAGGSGNGDDDDPALPVRRLKSAHEADVEPVRSVKDLKFACEPCLLAFPSEVSVRAHHGNKRDVFLIMHVDPRCDQILVTTFTLAQAAAIVRAARATGAGN